MLFDVFFFGFPAVFVICLGAHAISDSNPKFWRPAFSLFAYCTFYLVGGREVILYLFCAMLIGAGWLGSGGVAPPV